MSAPSGRKIITTSLGHADMAAEDRAYLVRLVMARTGLAQPDAERRVTEVIAQARRAIRRARANAVILAFMAAASFLAGAAVAWFAAGFGGRHRDGEAVPRLLAQSAGSAGKRYAVNWRCCGRPASGRWHDRARGTRRSRSAAKPSRRQCARMITVSPSSRKRRVSPEASVIGSRPPAVISSRLPMPSHPAPRSCRCRTGRPAAGCSRCWCDARPAAPRSSRDGGHCWQTAGAAAGPSAQAVGVSSDTSSAMSSAPLAWSAASRGRAAAPDRPRAATPARCGMAPAPRA